MKRNPRTKGGFRREGRCLSWTAFRTGLITPDYNQFPKFPYSAKNWWVSLRTPNDDEGWRGGLSVSGKRGRTVVHPNKEIMIHAQSEVVAQKAANSIFNALLLVQNWGGLIGAEPVVTVVHRTSKPSAASELTIGPPAGTFSAMGLPLACLVAARASYRLRFAYALAQLRLSYEMSSVAAVDLDPHHSPNIPKSPYLEDHVRLGYAIVLAYAAIEQMGLEVRASERTPSRLGGEWNPVVLQDLKTRLSKCKVDVDETFLWMVRGSQTAIEKDRPPKRLRKARWARYNVRDAEMSVVDAIAHVSWLRDKVAVHGVSPRRIRALSVYDVENARSLARHLLLQAMGLWKRLR